VLSFPAFFFAADPRPFLSRLVAVPFFSPKIFFSFLFLAFLFKSFDPQSSRPQSCHVLGFPPFPPIERSSADAFPLRTHPHLLSASALRRGPSFSRFGKILLVGWCHFSFVYVDCSPPFFLIAYFCFLFFFLVIDWSFPNNSLRSFKWRSPPVPFGATCPLIFARSVLTPFFSPTG